MVGGTSFLRGDLKPLFIPCSWRVFLKRETGIFYFAVIWNIHTLIGRKWILPIIVIGELSHLIGRKWILPIIMISNLNFLIINPANVLKVNRT